LDFTALHQGISLTKKLEITASKLKMFGLDAHIDHVKKKPLSLTARLIYNGPLFNGSEQSQGHIQIEISKRNDVFFVLGLKKQEVLSEKLRALSMRKKPRDLYDVWFLLKQQVKIDNILFEQKMNIVEKSPIVSINITHEDWERDLNILLEHPPSFELVKKEVIASLKINNISVKIE